MRQILQHYGRKYCVSLWVAKRSLDSLRSLEMTDRTLEMTDGIKIKII